MAYCSKCGKELGDGEMFCTSCGQRASNDGGIRKCRVCGWELYPGETRCSRCGAEFIRSGDKTLPVTPWGSTVIGSKSSFLGAFLSFLIPGIGTIYAGRVERGILLLLGAIILVPIVCFLLMVVGGAAGAMLSLVVIIGYYIYTIYDGYTSCKTVNELWTNYLYR